MNNLIEFNILILFVALILTYNLCEHVRWCKFLKTNILYILSIFWNTSRDLMGILAAYAQTLSCIVKDTFLKILCHFISFKCTCYCLNDIYVSHCGHNRKSCKKFEEVKDIGNRNIFWCGKETTRISCQRWKLPNIWINV